MAHFTDTFFELNGVTRTLRQQLELAHASGRDLTIFTCRYGEHTGQRGVRAFAPIGCYEVPVYPDQKIFFPPFLEMLDACYAEETTHIHAATPGTVGLAALAIGRILRIPVMATYHTAIPQYGRELTDDASVEEVAWRTLVWYYNMVDVVFVSSRANREELIERGVDEKRIRLFPRGVDTSRFGPDRKSTDFRERYGIPEDRVLLLYVGRISKEKNLALLAKAHARLQERRSDIHLVVVGDGPFEEGLREALAGTPHTCTGRLEGGALAEAYASCDLFVFPSTTDTFGNVVLEAQLSGLPVVVSDRGGPVENMRPGETGLVAPANDCEALVQAMERLVGDEDLRERMGATAHASMRNRSFARAFDQLWKMYGELGADQPAKERRHDPLAEGPAPAVEAIGRTLFARHAAAVGS